MIKQKKERECTLKLVTLSFFFISFAAMPCIIGPDRMSNDYRI